MGKTRSNIVDSSSDDRLAVLLQLPGARRELEMIYILYTRVVSSARIHPPSKVRRSLESRHIWQLWRVHYVRRGFNNPLRDGYFNRRGHIYNSSSDASLTSHDAERPTFSIEHLAYAKDPFEKNVRERQAYQGRPVCGML